MKKHFVAIGFDGTVLLSGTKKSDGISVSFISPKLSGSHFTSIDEVLMHQDVARLETPQPINESISAPTYSVGNVRLTRAESVIFDTLKKNQGECVPHEILIAVSETFGETNRKSIRTLMSRIRKKIASAGLTIEAIWKKGYRLKM